MKSARAGGVPESVTATTMVASLRAERAVFGCAAAPAIHTPSDYAKNIVEKIVVAPSRRVNFVRKD